jgi:hypothetical protein
MKLRRLITIFSDASRSVSLYADIPLLGGNVMQPRQHWHVTILGVMAFMLWAVAAVDSQSISAAPSITVYANPT